MVRFQWHVEDGFGAHIAPGAVTVDKDSGVHHILCDIDIPGHKEAGQALFSVPAGYLTEGKVKDVGIILGHGDKADEWQGPLLTQLAVALAKAGYVVIRYHSNAKELKRQRMYEKALDVCATSPFARFVQRWVLAGVGHGARLAAIVGLRVRGTICGHVFLSYPLTDSFQTARGPLLPDSSILLLRVRAPALFIHGSNDSKAPLSQIKTVAAQMKPSTDVRLAEVPGVDGSFQSDEPPVLSQATLAAITGPMLEFISCLQAGKLADCQVPRANPLGQPAVVLSESAAAGIAAQIAILDEDDTLVYEVEPLGHADPAAAGAAVKAGVMNGHPTQHVLQHQLQLQQAVLQQQQQLAAVAAKAGISLQQAAVQQIAAQRAAAAVAAAAAAGGGAAGALQLAKLPPQVAAAAAAAAAQAGGGSAAAAAASAPTSGPVAVAPMMLPTGNFITPQMLAAAQAMAAAAAKQGIRPGTGAQLVIPAGTAVAMQQQQQQLLLQKQESGKSQ